MNGGGFPSALREVRALLRHRTTIASLAGASLILGLSGPFDTFDQMRLLPRLAYWSTIVVVTFSLGAFVSAVSERMLANLARIVRFFLTSLAIGVAVSSFLFAFNTLAFGGYYADVWDWAETAVIIVIIAMAVEGGMSFAAAGVQAETKVTPPPLLDRLPHDKRGRLIAISAVDHYVEVRTTSGTALVLMRLADAISEAGDGGLQVHRSHWVATEQVKVANRAGDRAILTMTDNSEIPVSRSYMPAARDAGLLKG